MSGAAGRKTARPLMPELHMPTNDRNTGRYDDVWRASEPYMRARKNDVHIPLSFAFARKLLEAHPEADEDIVLLAMLLHDIGWWSIDMHDIIEKGFGPNMMQSDVALPAREGRRAAVARGAAEDRLAANRDRGGRPRSSMATTRGRRRVRSTTGWCAMPTSSGASPSPASRWPATGSSSIAAAICRPTGKAVGLLGNRGRATDGARRSWPAPARR